MLLLTLWGVQKLLEGYGLRAYGAHQNSLETFPFFASAVLSSVALGGDPVATRALSIAYVASRGVYVAVYLGGVNKALAAIRTVVFVLGLLVVLSIFILAVV